MVLKLQPLEASVDFSQFAKEVWEATFQRSYLPQYYNCSFETCKSGLHGPKELIHVIITGASYTHAILQASENGRKSL